MYRLLILSLLVACSGAVPPGSTGSTSNEGLTTSSTTSSTDTDATDTGSSTTDTDTTDTETSSTATGSSGTTADTGADCGPDCYLDDGLCVFPDATRARSELTDDLIDQRLDGACGPIAFVTCDTGSVAYGIWAGDNPEVEVYDASTRAWIASYDEEDDDISETCGNEAFYGDPAQLPCARELFAWLYASYHLGCDVLDGQTLSGKTDACENDPKVCVRDEWAR